MKASWWKYALIALVSLGVVACGKDNKAGGNGVVSNPIHDGIPQPVQTNTYEEFRNQVVAGNFKSLVGHNNAPLNYVVYRGYTTSYDWDPILWGLTHACNETFSSYMDKERSYSSGVYSHEYGSTQAAILAKIVSIVNAPQNYLKQTGTSWLIRKNGFDYLIDTSLPLLANPVSKRAIGGSSSNCSGEGYISSTIPSISY